MIKDAYVQYQLRKATEDLFDTMELLPGWVKVERGAHYIDDRMTVMSLHPVLITATLGDRLWQ